VHNFNVEIPPVLDEQYSVVIDGGTLEHVFDFPMAIRNSSRTVRECGHPTLNVPVNNFPGNSFYQNKPRTSVSGSLVTVRLSHSRRCCDGALSPRRR
jgi:hypothetical protein